MFTGVFVDLLLELIALVGIALAITIATIGIIFMIAVIIFVIKTAVEALKGKDDLEEETDDTRE